MALNQSCEDSEDRVLCLPNPFVTVPRNPEEEYDTDNDDDESDERSAPHHRHRWQYVASVLGDGPKDRRVGNGRVVPKKFTPPNEDVMPRTLFQIGFKFKADPPVRRFLNREDSNQVLVFAHGVCLDCRGRNAKAGCAIVYRDSTLLPPVAGYARFRLEKKGPTGEMHPQTASRAELRAVIAALRFRDWVGEGFTSLVLATHSDYVVEGITNKIQTWIRNDWKTNGSAAAKHRDLWQCLLGEIERWDELKLEVHFWLIRRAMNLEADRQAQKAATEVGLDNFMDVCGL